MEKGHILKFVIKGKTFDQNVGIRAYPQQTYGVSQQSPEHFKQKHTLKGDHGYIYKHQNLPQFSYPSQKKSYNIHKEVDEQDYTKLHIKLMENSMAFHRKKGRLSEFMDKNGWMSAVVPMMGFERTEKARFFSNRDRQERIKSLKPKKIYDPKVKTVKVNQEYFNTISSLMSEKLKIRKQRNELSQQSKLLQSARSTTLKKPFVDPIHIETIRQNMAKTKNDFYSTSSTFYNGNEVLRQQSKTEMRDRNNEPSKQSFRSSISKRGVSPAKTFKEVQKNPQDVIQRQDQNVEDWYRKTCQSKWAYKPKPVDSDQEL